MTDRLIQYVLNYMQYFSGSDYLIAAVSPAMADLYRVIMLFDLMPGAVVENYEFVKGVSAVGEFVHLSSVNKKYRAVYNHRPKQPNFCRRTVIKTTKSQVYDRSNGLTALSH